MSGRTCSLRWSMPGVLAVLVVLVCAPNAYPGDFRGPVNSPRARGMGACAIVLVDEESPLHNPGAMGVFHLARIAAVSLPNNTRWLPGEPNLDLRIRTWSMSAAANSMALPFKDTSLHVALALGFSRTSLRDPSSSLEGEVDIDEKLDGYSIGLAGEYFVRVGFGFTYSRFIYRDRTEFYTYEGDQSSGVLGALMEIPLTDLIRRLRNVPALEGARYELSVVPSFAYVSAARERVVYSYRSKRDFFQGYDSGGNRRFGAAIASTLAYKSLPLASCRLVYEYEREEIILGRVYTDKVGAEVGILGFAYGRIGKLENDPNEVESTFGLGASLRGLLVLLQHGRVLQAESALPRYVLEHLDISFDYARIEGGTHCLLDGAKFYKLRVSL